MLKPGSSKLKESEAELLQEMKEFEAQEDKVHITYQGLKQMTLLAPLPCISIFRGFKFAHHHLFIIFLKVPFDITFSCLCTRGRLNLAPPPFPQT